MRLKFTLKASKGTKTPSQSNLIQSFIKYKELHLQAQDIF